MDNPLSILRITIEDLFTHISYIDNGTKMFEYNSEIGEKYIRERKYNEVSANSWLSYILWCMHSISYIDRIPTNIILVCDKNSIWYAGVLERYSYAQFFTGKNKVRVILESNNKDYERHKETLSKFKI